MTRHQRKMMTCNMSEIPESQWHELCVENQRLKESLEWWEETGRLKTAEIERLNTLIAELRKAADPSLAEPSKA
jgi:predicted secreted hydrolase